MDFSFVSPHPVSAARLQVACATDRYKMFSHRTPALLGQIGFRAAMPLLLRRGGAASGATGPGIPHRTRGQSHSPATSSRGTPLNVCPAWLQHPLRPQGWLRGAPCPTTNLCQGEGAGTAHLCCPQLVWEGDPRAAYSQETLTPGPGAACPSPEQEPHKSPSSVAAPDTAPRNCSSCFALEKAPAPFTINQPPHHGSFLPFKGSS